MRGRKLPRVMRGSIGSRMEICGISGLPIPMVPRLHQSNGCIKRKLRAWRVQIRSYQSPWYRVCTKAMVISKGSYGYRELKMVLPLLVQIPYLPVRGRKLPRVMRGSIGSRMNGNMRNSGPINPHGTAFPPKQWLYQKEAKDMGIESSKICCTSQCRYRTY